MKVYFKPEGGFGFFPGLQQPLELNSDKLPTEEADHLKNLVDNACFYTLPPLPPKDSSSGADRKQYTIRVEDQDREHSVKVSDTALDAELQCLVDYLSSKQREARTAR